MVPHEVPESSKKSLWPPGLKCSFILPWNVPFPFISLHGWVSFNYIFFFTSLKVSSDPFELAASTIIVNDENWDGRRELFSASEEGCDRRGLRTTVVEEKRDSKRIHKNSWISNKRLKTPGFTTSLVGARTFGLNTSISLLCYNQLNRWTCGKHIRLHYWPCITLVFFCREDRRCRGPRNPCRSSESSGSPGSAHGEHLEFCHLH